MGMQWRSKGPKSAAPASSCRSSEPTSSGRSGDETTALRSKRWRKKQRQVVVRRWIPTRLLYQFNGNVKATLKAYAEEEKLMDQSALHASRRSSSSQSGDAQEEAPFDRDKTNLFHKLDKKPKPACSGDPSKIAQDEDEDGYSDKKPLTVVEDEHSDKIGAHATDEDHKQEQGRATDDLWPQEIMAAFFSLQEIGYRL